AERWGPSRRREDRRAARRRAGSGHRAGTSSGARSRRRVRAKEVRMAVATRGTASNYLQRAASPSGLADVVDLILDKGLVIDAYVRVSVIGIELITIDARIVIASVDTYLRFAEAVNRLDLNETGGAGLQDLRNGGSDGKGKGMIEGAKEAFSGNGGDRSKSKKD